MHFQTEEEFEAWASARGMTKGPDGIYHSPRHSISDEEIIPAPSKGSKMHNRTVTTEEGTFDSKGEYTFWVSLSWKQEAGLITHLQHHKRFCICDAIGPYPAIDYEVDFYYFDCEKDQWVAHEYKGYETPLFKLKRSLFLHQYPEIEYRQTHHKG